MLNLLVFKRNLFMAVNSSRFITVKLFLIFLTCFSLTINAKEFDAQHVKAAYIVNFFKHITWPGDEQKETYRLAIYKDRDYYNFLKSAIKNKSIKGKPIEVLLVSRVNEIKQFDSVYIAKQFNKETHDIANLLRTTSTLLITDNSDDKHDVMINLVQEQGSALISFEVNKSNIIYEKLSMSADLLLLGGSELDIANLYRETEMAMQRTKDQTKNLKKNLEQQQKKLAIQQNKLAQSSKELADAQKSLKVLNAQMKINTLAAQEKSVELEQLKTEVNKKQQQLDQQHATLKQILLQSKKTEEELSKQQLILAEKSSINEQVLATVKQNKEVLSLQKEELAQQRAQLKEQDIDLINKKEIINNQQAYLLVTTILTTIAILSALLIVFFFNKNKKINLKLTKTLSNLNDTQEQLVQSEKMASLGRLVAGVAHEINTPLSIAITANSLVLDDTLEVKEKIDNGGLSRTRMNQHISKSEESLLMSENALERVKHLLANFKLVAADQIVSEQREIDLSAYTADVMSTLSVEMNKYNIDYEYTGAESLMITTLPGVFSQVLTNLVMNSLVHGFDCKESGNIKVSLKQTAEGDAQMSYSDNGKGMDKNTLDNIYEPFFTTKRGEGSTGLGMNIVFNLVNQQLKGKLSVNSELDKGIQVTLQMPSLS